MAGKEFFKSSPDPGASGRHSEPASYVGWLAIIDMLWWHSTRKTLKSKTSREGEDRQKHLTTHLDQRMTERLESAKETLKQRRPAVEIWQVGTILNYILLFVYVFIYLLWCEKLHLWTLVWTRRVKKVGHLNLRLQTSERTQSFHFWSFDSKATMNIFFTKRFLFFPFYSTSDPRNYTGSGQVEALGCN